MITHLSFFLFTHSMKKKKPSLSSFLHSNEALLHFCFRPHDTDTLLLIIILSDKIKTDLLQNCVQSKFVAAARLPRAYGVHKRSIEMTHKSRSINLMDGFVLLFFHFFVHYPSFSRLRAH